MAIGALTGFTPLLTISFGTLLLATLAAVIFFDVTELRIPDSLNILLLMGGLAQALMLGLSEDRAIHVAVGYALAASVACGGLFWIVRQLHHRLRGHIGLGLGDVKMAAALAPWVHPANISLVILMACLTGLIYVLFARGREHFVDRGGRIPFGLFLGLGLIFIWATERVVS
ncbi:MAG: A24 family peptidase [Pseudomonadota bacterium]